MKGGKVAKTSRRTKRQAFYGMLYILPSFLIIMTFCVVAIIMTFYFSLTDFNMYSSPKFVGLKNYISIFKNDTFYAALVNTVKYVIVTVPAQVILSLGIAAFIAEKLRNKYGSFLRRVIFIPQIISAIAASAVWKIIFKNDGILNGMVEFLGLHLYVFQSCLYGKASAIFLSFTMPVSWVCQETSMRRQLWTAPQR